MKGGEGGTGSKAKVDIRLGCPVLSLEGSNLILFTLMLKLTYVGLTVNDDIFVEPWST